MSEAAEQRIADLEELNAGLERMMYFVLDAVGEPVFIPNEKIEAGIQQDKTIDIMPDQQRDGWVFSVKDTENEG